MKRTFLRILTAALPAAALFPACGWWQRGAPESLKLYGNFVL
jgi:hypothetical protein